MLDPAGPEAGGATADVSSNDSVGALEATLDISPNGAGSASLHIALPLGYDAVVGRSDVATIQITGSGVSRRHARLVHDERGVIVADLGSTNGTYINGEQITEPFLLQDGDTITFGLVGAVYRESTFAEPQRAKRLSSDSHSGAGTGFEPLTPEAPIGSSQAESRGEEVASKPSVPQGKQESRSYQDRPGEFRGTVLNVIQPVININPWLVLDIRTESGQTFAVRARFFWGLIRAPYVAEGHHVRVGGRITGGGYIKPRYIINETTGSRWKPRWH